MSSLIGKAEARKMLTIPAPHREKNLMKKDEPPAEKRNSLKKDTDKS